MTNDDVKCPLCEGHGHLPRLEMMDRLSNQGLLHKLGEYLASLVEAGGVLAGTGPARSFEKDVHNWNPQLPMWRRSPKE